MAFPTYGNEHSAGTLVRQFIRLTPGKTYTVMIYSTTCGNGALGALRSDPVMMTITLPPSEPPTIVDSTDTTTTSLTWQQGIIPGMYDDFRVTGLEGNITVTLIREDTYMLIEIPLHPIRYSLVYYRSNALPLNSLDHSITIRNPCSVYPNAKIVVYPVCPDSTSTECSTVVRRLCTIPLFRPTKPGRPGQRNDPDPGSLSIVLPTQACCSGITYSPLEAKCCHNQLVHEGTANLGCCFTRWYNVSSQTCCGNGRVRSLLNGCS
uniref:Galaxin-like repeats domain-containing protein n=1 Tax=Ciona savignyi TaxID=51511 RepID=H2ZK79_CIOSA